MKDWSSCKKFIDTSRMSLGFTWNESNSSSSVAAFLGFVLLSWRQHGSLSQSALIQRKELNVNHQIVSLVSRTVDFLSDHHCQFFHLADVPIRQPKTREKKLFLKVFMFKYICIAALDRQKYVFLCAKCCTANALRMISFAVWVKISYD